MQKMLEPIFYSANNLTRWHLSKNLSLKQKSSTNQHTLSLRLCSPCHKRTYNCQECSYTSSDAYTHHCLPRTRLCLQQIRILIIIHAVQACRWCRST